MSEKWLECQDCQAKNNLDKEKMRCKWCGGKVIEKVKAYPKKTPRTPSPKGTGKTSPSPWSWPLTSSKEELERLLEERRQQ